MKKRESPETHEQMKVAREVMARRRKGMWALAQGIMEKDRDLLRELSKR